MNLDKRFWEIDSLRGIAVVLMIVFHVVYDLAHFGGKWFAAYDSLWMNVARTAASIFILLVGVSLSLSFSRANAKGSASFSKYFGRGLKIFGFGLLITAVTWVFYREGFIFFGVLHLIGVSIIIAYPFLRLKYWNLGLSLLAIAGGILLAGMRFGFPWLAWLGLMPNSLYPADYFPLLPWFGVVLAGLFLGNVLYPDYKPIFKLPDLSKSSAVRFFCFLGRHSLVIYLVHQPILVAIVKLLVG